MSYLADTEYAMQGLLQLATQEEVALAEMLVRLQHQEEQLKVLQWDFQTSDLNDDFSDAYVMAAFARAARAGEEVRTRQEEVAILQASVGAKQHSVQAICASILQIAKQGISLIHGGLADAPAGRMIGTSRLKDIVWQARNQALHYEDGQFSNPVVELFAALEASHGQTFALAAHRGKSLAKPVVYLLGWQTYEDYATDARLLGLG